MVGFSGDLSFAIRDADSMIDIAGSPFDPGAQAARDAQGSDATLEDQVLVLQMLWSERS